MAKERLIEAVRKHTELYDTRDENYMKTKLKNRIWEDLAKELNFKSGKEAKTLWLKLRGSYRDARRRQIKYMKSGVAGKRIKPWRYQKQMSFLDPYTSAGLRVGNVNVESDEDSENELMSNEVLEIVEVIEEHEESNVENSEDDNERSSSEPFVVPSVAHSTQPKKRIQDKIRGGRKRSVKLREEKAQELVEDRKILQSSTDDPLYNFFLSMYQLTKPMPLHYQHKIRSKLFQAVSQAEEEIINISSPSSMLATSSATCSQHPSSQTSPNSQQTVCIDCGATNTIEHVTIFQAP